MAIFTEPVLERQQEEGIRHPVVATMGLMKQFNHQYAVQDVTFEVPKGVIFGFIGPSGSGKTTTIRLLLGVYKPTSGEVLVLGTPPSQFSQQERARIGYMPQHFVFYPYLTVWENLNFAASIYGMSLFRKKQLKEALEFVELYDDRDKQVNHISGGMQRRLSLAATLVHKPDLIFLDEPTAGIDPVLRRKFWDQFGQLRQDGRTLFVTTQYVNEAAYCDLVAVMAEGKLLMVDTPEGLRHRAYHGEIVNLTTARPLDNQIMQELRNLPFVIEGKVLNTGPRQLQITVRDAKTAIPDIIEWAQSRNIDVETLDEYLPPFEDVFVELVKGEGEHG